MSEDVVEIIDEVLKRAVPRSEIEAIEMIGTLRDTLCEARDELIHVRDTLHAATIETLGEARSRDAAIQERDNWRALAREAARDAQRYHYMRERGLAVDAAIDAALPPIPV